MQSNSKTLTALPLLQAEEHWQALKDNLSIYEECPIAATRAANGTCGEFTAGARHGTWAKGQHGLLKVDWTADGVKTTDDPEGLQPLCGGFKDVVTGEGVTERTFYGGKNVAVQWVRSMNPSNSQFDQGSPTRKRFLATKDAFEPPTSEHATGIPEVQAIERSYIVHPNDDAEIKRDFFKFEVAPDRSFKNSFSFTLNDLGIAGNCWPSKTGRGTEGRWVKGEAVEVQQAGGWKEYEERDENGDCVKCTELESTMNGRTGRVYTEEVNGTDISNGYFSVG